MFLVPALGVFIYAAIFRMRRPLIEYIGLGAAAGCYVAVTINTGGAVSFLNTLQRAPASLVDGVQVMLSGEDLIKTARAQAFHADRFQDHGDAKTVLAELAAQTPGDALPTFFVLGDSPFFYVLAKRLPPYHVNDYNAAPLIEQTKVAAYIERERPQYVIWDPATLTMDSIQNTVRNPTIYNTVIESYIPKLTVDKYEVLSRRATNAPIAMGYWRDKIGSRAKLGTIPRQSSFERFEPCENADQECREFLRLEVTDWKSVGQTLVVPLSSGGHSFEIELQLLQPEPVYHVSLNRLWFWDVAKRHGGNPRISYGKLPSGVKASILRRALRPDILY
jgi:hypothetical protein